MVANVANISEEDKRILIQASLIISALATLIQIFPLFRTVGAGLPCIFGSSFIYVPTLMSIAGTSGISAIFGAQIIGGIVAIIFALFLKPIRRLFPPLVTGTVILSIGLSLYPTAVKYMAGGAGSDTFGDPKNWIVALITLAVVIFCNFFTKGFMKLSSILIGLIVGYIVALLMGMVNFSAVNSASLVSGLPFMHFGISFDLTSIATLSIIFIVNSVQAIGDLTAASTGGLDREPTNKELSGGIMANGVVSIVGAFWGGMPIASFSQNIGIVTVTKVVNRCVMAFAAITLLIAGFVPKFSAVLTTIPYAVLGGATISVFATIAMTGIKILVKQPLSMRNTSVIGISIALGMGVTQVSGALQGFPVWVNSVFGQSAVVITTVVAVILNLILPCHDEDKAKN